MCRGIQTDRLPGYPFAHLPHALIMMYKDDFNIDGSSLPNQCLMRLIKAKHPHWQKPFAWKGDLVIIKAKANVTDHQSFMDMTRGDAHALYIWRLAWFSDVRNLRLAPAKVVTTQCR